MLQCNIKTEIREAKSASYLGNVGSGKTVGKFGGRQACSGNVRTEVDVPKAGWYPLKVAYFQKYSNKCLMMKWSKKGQKLTWVPNSAFGY